MRRTSTRVVTPPNRPRSIRSTPRITSGPRWTPTAHDWEINGVVHSHTHSEPYPSPTDVAQAPDPGWHYVIVSLKRDLPELRSYRIVDGRISEEPIELASER